MLIHNNFRHQFYEIVKKEHVLVIVGDDADALCAYTILTQLFIWDDVSYSMVPVDGWDGLDKVLRQHFDQSPTIVLLNCGGNRSLQDLQVPPESTVFIIDSKRPFHHENIFDGHQIRLLIDSVEIDQLKIPEIHDVIDEGGSDEEEPEEDPEDNNVRKRGLDSIQKKVLKQETRRQWKQRRNSILWQYYESAWYSVATSVKMLELAASLNRATPELMWIAAVGLNSQWTDKLITIEAYTDICYNRMRPFIHKFSPRNAPKANDLLRISFDKELPLAMYSHWSLYRAMMVNDHFACKTKNWTQKGDSDVKHLLANLGLTLSETKQKFEAMSSDRKKEVTETLEKEMASSFASFVAHLGYCNRVNAADVARGVAARLETPRKQPLLERFESARSVLLSFMDGTGDFIQMLKTFELYKASIILKLNMTF